MQKVILVILIFLISKLGLVKFSNRLVLGWFCAFLTFIYPIYGYCNASQVEPIDQIAQKYMSQLHLAGLALAKIKFNPKNIQYKRIDKTNGTVTLVLQGDPNALLKKLEFRSEKGEVFRPAPVRLAPINYVREQKSFTLSQALQDEEFNFPVADFEKSCEKLEAQEAIINKWKALAEIKEEPVVLALSTPRSQIKKIGYVLRFDNQDDCQSAFNFFDQNGVKAELLRDRTCPFDDEVRNMVRLDGVADLTQLMQVIKDCNTHVEFAERRKTPEAAQDLHEASVAAKATL